MYLAILRVCDLSGMVSENMTFWNGQKVTIGLGASSRSCSLGVEVTRIWKNNTELGGGNSNDIF